MRIEFYETIDSTQRRARELVERGDRQWDAVCADHQTAGRGRQGAHWHDTPRQSLLVSLILWDARLPEPAGLVGLFAALAAAQSLEAHYPDLPPVQLKYPNDLMIHGRKLGGLLTEIVEGVAIVGIGINLGQREFPPELERIAVSVWQAVCPHPPAPLFPGVEEGATDAPLPRWERGVGGEGNIPQPERAQLIESIYQNLLHTLHLWHTSPLQVFTHWQARDCSAGRAYRVQDLSDHPVGVALGIEADFRLRLRLPSGMEHSTYYVSAV
ncbi:MAG: biotin--[acetyl-CoA-carboxylase] ligase [Fimbriimonadales bacterium]|nr:biotin--[acetyl-CoA-carboxylase] ligase [Fimbriimonadales bacterium]